MNLIERWRAWRRRYTREPRAPDARAHEHTAAPDMPRPQGLPGFPIDSPYRPPDPSD